MTIEHGSVYLPILAARIFDLYLGDHQFRTKEEMLQFLSTASQKKNHAKLEAQLS